MLGVHQPALGWGRLGHQLVCDTAWTLLDTQAREAVQAAYLQAGHRSFADACNYADELRSDRRWDWLKPWHYINVPQDAITVRQQDCGKRGCVVQGISSFAEQFINAEGAAQRHDALLLISHLVGDLHQPLHVSYADDRGGTRRKVTVENKRHNLHYVWDSLVITRKQDAEWRVLGTQLRQDYSPLAETIKPGNFGAWADESLHLTRRIYQELPVDGRLDEAYFSNYQTRVEQRLVLAGYRLAHLINTLTARP